MKKINAATTLEGTINALIEERKKGNHVYCIFEGHILRSDTISYDLAYQEVFGKSKKEIEEIKKMEKYNALQRAQDIAAKCESLVPGFIERGKKVIFEEHHNEWVEFVNANKGMPSILVAALEIMEKLDQGYSIEEANQVLIDRRDTIYPVMVTKIVLRFSPFGAHFYQDYNCVINPEKSYYEWKMLEEINAKNMIIGRKNGKIIPELVKGFTPNEEDTLEDVLSTLFAAQEKGIRIFAMFHGKKLYSETITSDIAYMKVYGVTKAEFFNEQKKKIKTN